MAIRFSTGLKNRILNLTTGTPPGSSLGDAIDDGQLIIYSGSPPASPDDAATGTVLVTYVENATGSFNLTFEASTSGGSLVKAASQTWSGVSSASGTGGYFRYVVSGDDGTADPTQVRIQGTVGGAGADLFLASSEFDGSSTYFIDAFAIAIPDL
jgi:hypothetical protein